MTLAVGIDLLPAQERLARLAGRLAVRGGAGLFLVHVATDPRAPMGLAGPEGSLLADTRRGLADLGARVAAATGARVETDLWAGSRPESLASAAESVVARALLLPDEGPGGGRLFGSEVERVVREARVPVVAVRQPERLEAWAGGERPLEVLVGSDTGESAARALRFTRSLTAFGPVRVTVLSVADPRATSRRYGFPEPADGRRVHPDAEAALRRDLEAQLAEAGLPDAAVVIRAGAASPETHLAVHAEDHDVDLVVVGTRRRSWIEEAWYGSVAHGVLRGVGANVACVPRTLLDEREAPRAVPPVLLVATDLSPVGDAALAVAYGYVAAGGVVHLVHVLDGERVAVPGKRLSRGDIDRRLHQRIPPGAAERGVTTRTHVVGGETAEAIVALGERVGAGAICIASVGRSALGAAAFGSVSRDVVALARCPVIVVPAPRE